MGLAAYMDLTRPKYDLMICEECGHPKETLCGWEGETPLRWVCPECYGTLREKEVSASGNEEKMNEEIRKSIIGKLNQLDDGDKESSHWDADDILLEALDISGNKDISDAWRAARKRIGFWYS